MSVQFGDKRAGDAAAVSPLADLARLHLSVSNSVLDARDDAEVLARLVPLLASITNAAAVLSWSREGQSHWQRGPAQVAQQVLQWFPQLYTVAADEVIAAVGEARLRVTRLDAVRPLVVCSLPLGEDASTEQCLQLILLIGSQALEPFLVILQLLGGYLRLCAPLAQARQETRHLEFAAATMELCERVLDSAPGTAYQAVCDLLARHGECQAVVFVAHDERGRCRYRAAAGLGPEAARGETAHSAERAAVDALFATPPVVAWSDGDAEITALAAFARSHAAQQVRAVPLRLADGRAIGVICASWRSAGPRADALMTLLELGGNLLASALAAHTAATPGLWRRAWQWSRHTRQHRYFVPATLGLLVALLCLPVAHRVAVDVTLVAAEYRYVAAPFAGILATSHHKVGDSVNSGALLAEMDGHDLANELGAIEADLAKAAKQRDVALAQGASAAVQLANYDYERFAVRREVVLRRQSELQISSPISGVIVKGDLDKARGAAVEVGQILYEIAPLAELEIEAAVSDEDVRWVQVGQRLDYDLDAFRGTSHRLQLDHLRPRAEIRDQRNVFVASARLANPDGELRPGMSGVGHVYIDRRALAWVLLHKPLMHVVRWLAW